MDRLSSLLELFSPKTLKVELLSEQYSELEFSGDSTIGLVYRGSAELFTNNRDSLIINHGDILWITPGNQSALKSFGSRFPVSLLPSAFWSGSTQSTL